MLESELKKLTTAVEANTAALLGAAPAAAKAAAPAAAVDAAPAAVAAAKATTEPVPAATVDIPIDTAPEVTVTLKMITEGIVNLCKAKGRESAALLMAEYGAQKVPELKAGADRYPEIYAKNLAKREAK